MAKLTLHVPEELVAVAKSQAKAREVSVSKLVTDFFRNLASLEDRAEEGSLSLSPMTKRLAGCLLEANEEDYIDYLEKKHS